MPTSAIRSTITDMRRRRGMAAPVTRRVSILPEPNFDDAASAVDMSSLVDAEARARAAEERLEVAEEKLAVARDRHEVSLTLTLTLTLSPQP